MNDTTYSPKFVPIVPPAAYSSLLKIVHPSWALKNYLLGTLLTCQYTKSFLELVHEPTMEEFYAGFKIVLINPLSV